MSYNPENIQLTHSESDVDFNIYYQMIGDSADITGIYLPGSQVDLIDVIDDYVINDLQYMIEEQ